MKRLKIMIFNVGYLTGITGFFNLKFLFKLHHFIFSSYKYRRDISKKIADAINNKKPDIVFLEEIRNKSYMLPIKNLFNNSYIDSKYENKSILNYVPFFRGNCNGVFLFDDYPLKKLFFKNGTKKLIYQINIDNDLFIFFSHFALSEKVRRNQFS